MKPGQLMFNAKIAGRVAADELLTARALGHDWDSTYQSAVDVIDDIIAFTQAADLPAIESIMIMIGNRR